MTTHLYGAFNAHKRKIIILTTLIVVSLAGYVGYFRFFGLLPQSTIYLFQKIDTPTASDRIIVFSPHPDDETLGVGGYMASAEAGGATVYVVFATDGNHLRLKVRRATEAVAATTTLGVPSDHLVFYNYPDGTLSEHHTELLASLSQTINQIKPTKTFVTDELDIHPDHSELGKAVREASLVSGQTVQNYTFLIHYPKYPRPQSFRPQQFLLPPIALISQNRQWLQYDLSRTDQDKKNEAVLQYKSQLRTPFLHSLMLSFIRQNELFSKETP